MDLVMEIAVCVSTQLLGLIFADKIYQGVVRCRFD